MRKMRSYSPHRKKLFGTLFVLVWLSFYIFVVMGIGVRILPHADGVSTLIYYALAGMLWIVPVGLLLPWMHRGPK